MLPLSALAADSFPDPAEVTAAMKKATSFYTEKLAVHGGYASSWTKDLSMAFVEGKKGTEIISMQPPGTTTVGLAMLKGYQATGDAQFLEAARGAAKALIECQLASGGWLAEYDFSGAYEKKYHLRKHVLAGDTEPGKREFRSTLDDNKTQSALLLLLELASLPESKDDQALQDCLKFGMDSLLGAQYPNGAWPQQFEKPADPAIPVLKARYPADWPRTFPKEKYTDFYTLNDGNMEKIVQLLLRAYDLTKEERYLNSAKKTGNFFILAQMPEPQPGWAQQYNHQMEPVWARKFEPPCVSGGESLSTMKALYDLYVVTGDEKYMKPLPAAFAWYERSVLPDGKHARFYELKTNKPLYFVKDTYELVYDDSNLPTHYGFKLDWIQKDLKQLREIMSRPREEILAKRSGPDNEKSWASRAKGVADKTVQALKAQAPEGFWLNDEEIDAGEFVRHFNAMSIYVEGAKKGGDIFAKMRAK
ncbi:PelA/Pel-15E family pectate lyase [Prosthecobacter fusiformis]|uniref:PelA/Pel-15E family pectate lyase n=1 Tax=Prosthecobacter fusiformis TaxID=48464 RepID=A0A4R7SR74_9BACT|nr:pectate lyase [Prosthecobacter fusiformis]TDU81601.1 PelA/Pel-15E family pectate lyase [Prosthecobacter fusiformis]